MPSPSSQRQEIQQEARMRLIYNVSTRLWLSLEDYHNAGLTSEQTKEIIERLYDPVLSGTRLRCSPMGINGNWIVETWVHNDDACIVVDRIKHELDYELRQLRIAKTTPKENS
jgi:hypothetical protein